MPFLFWFKDKFETFFIYIFIAFNPIQTSFFQHFTRVSTRYTYCLCFSLHTLSTSIHLSSSFYSKFSNNEHFLDKILVAIFEFTLFNLKVDSSNCLIQKRYIFRHHKNSPKFMSSKNFLKNNTNWKLYYIEDFTYEIQY